MRTVSHQGMQLSSSERRSLELRRQVQATFMNTVLKSQVEQTEKQLDQRKEQGAKPERVWFVEVSEKGTPWLGDAFGF